MWEANKIAPDRERLKYESCEGSMCYKTESVNQSFIYLIMSTVFNAVALIGDIKSWVGFAEEEKTRVPACRKCSWSREENQQTQPTCDAMSGNRNPDHVGGRRVLSSPRQACSLLFSNAGFKMGSLLADVELTRGG